MADLLSREANWDDEPRYRVLLQTQFTHKEIVNDVLASHEEFDFPIHRYGQGWNDDVVVTRWIAGIKSNRISQRGIDLSGVKTAELSVRPGVTEVEHKLVFRDLDADRIRVGLEHSPTGPGFSSEECQPDEEDSRKTGPQEFHRIVATEELHLLTVIPIFQDDKSQSELGKNKHRGRNRECHVVLVIDSHSRGRDCRRRIILFRKEYVDGRCHHQELCQRKQKRRPGRTVLIGFHLSPSIPTVTR